MIVKKADEVPGQEMHLEGASGVTFRALISEGEGAPNFLMRQFDLAPDGYTVRHSHPWEHEIYVLAGSGVVVAAEDETAVSTGACILISPDEEHQMRNVGREQLKFLCLVPRTR